jgi:hypothetical protein
MRGQLRNAREKWLLLNPTSFESSRTSILDPRLCWKPHAPTHGKSSVKAVGEDQKIARRHCEQLTEALEKFGAQIWGVFVDTTAVRSHPQGTTASYAG